MAVTNKGVTYPSSSDNIAPLETHFAQLAEDADNVGVATGSYSFTGPSAAAGVVTVTVTFPTALSAAPKVICAVADSASASAYIANIYGTPTTTGFVAKVYKVSGSTAETLNLTWFASTYA